MNRALLQRALAVNATGFVRYPSTAAMDTAGAGDFTVVVLARCKVFPVPLGECLFSRTGGPGGGTTGFAMYNPNGTGLSLYRSIAGSFIQQHSTVQFQPEWTWYACAFKTSIAFANIHAIPHVIGRRRAQEQGVSAGGENQETGQPFRLNEYHYDNGLAAGATGAFEYAFAGMWPTALTQPQLMALAKDPVRFRSTSLVWSALGSRGRVASQSPRATSVASFGAANFTDGPDDLLIPNAYPLARYSSASISITARKLFGYMPTTNPRLPIIR